MDEASPPFPALPPAEPRAASLDLQVEQVTLALSHLRDTQARLEQMEGRLAAMTETCAGILDRWARHHERHASAVLELHTRLSEEQRRQPGCPARELCDELPGRDTN